MVGINEKSVSAFVVVEPVQVMLENEKIVFFGPVQGKSPQSAKLAHA